MNNASTPPAIGRYTLIRELGRGGMAIVYEAYDAAFERPVALKVLPNERLADEAMRARFLREARLIASLEHEAIVPVYDYGEEGGQPYFVMRYMTGGTLADRLAHVVLSPAEAVALIERLAPALDEAHQRAIIHRDLKPANILFDESGLPYLSDFGIAKLVGDDQTAESRMIGTPAYMSPEQISGRQPVDGRSDLYGVGILLWEMLTGSPPFVGTPLEVAQQHLAAPLPALRAPHAELPSALEGVLQRALAKEPGDRYASMARFVRALRAAVPAPVPVRQPVTADAAASAGWPATAAHQKPRRALPLVWIIGGLALLSGAAAFLLRPQAPLEALPAPSPAVAGAALVAQPTRPAAGNTPLALSQSAPELPALPTRPPSTRVLVTSTPVRVPPTATVSPTAEATETPPPPTAEPTSRAPEATVAVARGIYLNPPSAAGAGGMTFSARVVGLQAGESVLLLYATNAQLRGATVVTGASRTGDSYRVTVPQLPAGTIWWTMAIRDTQGSFVWYGDTASVRVAAPAAAATLAPPSATAVPPTVPPTAPPPPPPPPPPSSKPTLVSTDPAPPPPPDERVTPTPAFVPEPGQPAPPPDK